MGTLAVGKALGTGFGLIWRRPSLLPVWGLIYLVFSLVPTVLMGEIEGMLESSIAPDQPSPVAAAFGVMAWKPLLWAVTFVVAITFAGAVFRAVLRPDDRRYFYLRLSRAELWLGVTYLVQIVLFLIACVVLTAATGVLSHFMPRFLASLAGLAGGSACVWLGLRMSIAGPMAFAQERFTLVEAWRLTKGHGLRLGGILIAQVAIVFGVAGAVATPVVALAEQMGALRGAAVSDPVQLLVQAGTWLAIGLVILSVFAVATYCLMGAPWADAYRQLMEPSDPPLD